VQFVVRPSQTNDMMRQIIILRVLCAWLAFCGAESTRRVQESNQPKVLFGTRNGYDVGGPDPLCWLSEVDANQTASGPMDSLGQRNNAFFENGNVKLLPSCGRGIAMRVQPLDLGTAQEMLLGESYTFQVDFQMRMGATTKFEAERGVQFIHFRIHVCDVVEQGFCNPVKDTRQLDSSLLRVDAEIVPDDSEDTPDFESNSTDRWSYKEGTILLGLVEEREADGVVSLSFASRWVRWKLIQDEQNPFLWKSTVKITFQLPAEYEPVELGRLPYMLLGHVVVDTDFGERLDVAQTVDDRVVFVKAPAELLLVTSTTKIIVAVTTSFVGILAIGCMSVIARFRNHTVMRMAQTSFLFAMAGACLMAVAFSFTFLPVNDVFCRLRGSLVSLPMHAIAAILVARVWRIYRTLSAVSGMGKQSDVGWIESLLVGFLNFSSCSYSGSTRSSLRGSIRQTATPRQALNVVLVLLTPQAILQAVRLVVSDARLVIEYSNLGDIGREVCSQDTRWFALAGDVLICFTFVVAVIMSWFSRDLPSVFNEKDQVFNAATMATVLASIKIVMREILRQPSTPPDAQVRSCLYVPNSVIVLILVINSGTFVHIRDNRNSDCCLAANYLAEGCPCVR